MESVGLCLKNGGSTEKESKKKETKKVNNSKSNKKGGERTEKNVRVF